MIDVHGLMATAVKAVVIFASTNLDDIVLLMVLFSDSRLRPRTVVVGQYVGISILVLVSTAAGAAAVAIPAGWISLVGVVPLALGLYKGVELVRARGDDKDEEGRSLARGFQVLAVAGVTLANGGDNLGVYIPLFAVERSAVLVYIVIFAVLTALWCVLGYKLVNNRAVGEKLRRYGHIVLPVVLILLGVHILASPESR